MFRIERYPSGHIETISWQFPIPTYPIFSTFEATAFVYACVLILAEAMFR